MENIECMYCHRPLGPGDRCPHCGRDVTMLRRIVRASNAYYNIGLEKAKVRDLSGAAVYLEKSLELYKRNTDARNLLGLIYFEMGEVVDALAEWVISKNLQPENNRAADYLKKLQARQSRLRSLDHTMKKFNQALYYAQTGNDDLALLQARKVINMDKGFIKAYQLLGLLYIKKGEYAKAEKTLKAVLAIDVNNTTAIRYLNEIRGMAKKASHNPKKERPVADDFAQTMPSDDVIVPTYREGIGSWSTVLLMLTGLLVGVLFTFFLILPVRERMINNQNNETILKYNEKITERDTNITSLENTIEELQAGKLELETNLAAYTGEGGIIEEYNKLLNILNLKAEGKYIEAMDTIASINGDAVADASFQSVYQSLMSEFNDSGVANLFRIGKGKYDSAQWAEAEVYFKKILALQPDYPEVIFYTGICRQNQGDWPGAVEYYNQLINNPSYASGAWGQAALTQRGY